MRFLSWQSGCAFRPARKTGRKRLKTLKTGAEAACPGAKRGWGAGERAARGGGEFTDGPD